jgi:hypothetical protein
MKTHFLTNSLWLGISFFATALFSQAQTPSSTTWTSRGPSQDWRALTCSKDGSKLAAAIAGKTITLSTDGGVTWTSANSGTGRWVCIASSGDGKQLIAGQDSGPVKVSSDSGATWIEQTPLGSGSWKSVASNKDGTVLAAAYSGSTLRISTDSGTTWTERGDSTYWTCVDLSDDGKTVVAGSQSGLKISTDSGITWSDLTGAGQRVWKTLAISADGSRIVAGVMRGKVYTGVKSGTDWTWTEHLTDGQWTSVAMSDDGSKLVAANSGGQMQVSSDQGATWTAQGDTANWACVTTNQTGTLTVAGIWDGTASSVGTYSAPVIYSTNATLRSLTITQGTVLTPKFSSGKTNYQATRPKDGRAPVVDVLTSDPKAKVQTRCFPNDPFDRMVGGGVSRGLTANSNQMEVKVTAPDGITTKTYIVKFP